MFHRGKFMKCIEYCKLAIYLAENHNYTGLPDLLYKILLTKTQSYMITGQYSEALTALTFMLEIAFNEKCQQREVKVYEMLAIC